MPAPERALRNHRARVWASRAGATAALIGLSVLVGWTFGVDHLKSIYGPITMKTNAAIGLLLCGTALWSLERHDAVSAWCAAAVAAIGAATLSQHLIGWDLGIDQLLFTEAPGAAATASPNRMGPHAATSFIFAGSALLLLRRGAPGSGPLVLALTGTGLVFSLVAITGYAYGATALFGIARYTGIALHTAVALFVLHAGTLAAGSRVGVLSRLREEGPAGTMIRRLALPVIGLPLLIGYLTVLGIPTRRSTRGSRPRASPYRSSSSCWRRSGRRRRSSP